MFGAVFGAWGELLLAQVVAGGLQPQPPPRSPRGIAGARGEEAPGCEEDRPGFDFLLWPYWVLLGNYLTFLTLPPFSRPSSCSYENWVKHEIGNSRHTVAAQ